MSLPAKPKLIDKVMSKGEMLGTYYTGGGKTITGWQWNGKFYVILRTLKRTMIFRGVGFVDQAAM